MSGKDELLNKIVSVEWEMFSAVKAIDSGSSPTCQEDKQSFIIMRCSNFSPWPDTLLSHYLEFIVSAQTQERNVITEKYAFMMRSTDPDAYSNIKNQLPEVPEVSRRLIEKCISIHLNWKKELDQRHPSLKQIGRVLESSADTRERTSIETYLRGELSTYPLSLLEEYCLFLDNLLAHERNGAEEVLTETVRLLGFSSIKSFVESE